MTSFYPSRASPQASPRQLLRNKFPNLGSLDTTGSSITSSASAALSGLTDKDIELIDEIIERSPPTATTFLTVFKAYNEVLAERNMDAANDVTYYKLLLKLGVVKGGDWGTKWNTVKATHGYGSGGLNSTVDITPTATPRASRVAPSISRIIPHGNRLTTYNSGNNVSNAKYTSAPAHNRIRQLESRLNPSRTPLSTYRRDSVTVHSHQDEEESDGDQTETDGRTEMNSVTETGTDTSEDQITASEQEFSSPPTTLLTQDRASNLKGGGFLSKKNLSKYPPLPSVDQFLPVQVKNLRSEFGSEFSSDLRTRTSSSPRKIASSSAGRTPFSGKPTTTDYVTPSISSKLEGKSVAIPNQSIDEEDAWKKVKMERDEKEADRFREVVLLERCWEIWKGGFEWINSMNQKVDSHSAKMLKHRCYKAWKQRSRKRTSEYQQAGTLHETYLLKQSLVMWRSKLKEMKLHKWKVGLRKKMTDIKDIRDDRILKGAWTKWRLRHIAESAEVCYEKRLLWRMILAWRDKLTKIENMEEEADELALNNEQNRIVQMWDFWKTCLELKEGEKIIKGQVHKRLKLNALQVWKNRRSLNSKADKLHDKYIVKHFYSTWKKSISKQQVMVQKAEKYKNRQDNILLLAIFRMWIARERGQLMDRMMKQRTVHVYWAAWKNRIEETRKSEARALEFRNRPSAALARAAFDRWRQLLKTKQSIQEQAGRYDQDLLVHRMLLVWRIQLRVRLKRSKQAKAARRFFLVQKAWNKWKDVVKEKKREEKLKNLELKFQQNYFERWKVTAVRQRQHRTALGQFRTANTLRIMKDALSTWTNHVIALKLRELEVVEKRDNLLIQSCFDRWKTVFKRHADDLRLMQSYQLVKREEILRRMFSRWLTATKKIRYRRAMLQEREEEMKLALTERAWDRWRERFQEERLRPLELAFIVQLQKSRVYQAYMIWHSKTKSVPAIQFFSSSTKAKFWRMWRDAMPKALQAREARQHDRKKLLSRALDKWANAYRVKIALKAVARARYLRLPSGAPRQSLPLSTALRGVLRSSPSVTSAKTTRRTISEVDRTLEQADSIFDDDLESVASTRRPPGNRASRLSLAKPINRRLSDVNTSREGSIDIWRELRRAQRRLPSER